MHIFNDVQTTLLMALPPIFSLAANQLLLLSSKTLPNQTHSAVNYTICGIAIFTILILKRRFFLTQAIAVFFVAKGLDQIPSVEFDNEDFNDTNNMYGQWSIVLAILCYGISSVILEKILKSSEVSLWVRGIQLNLFVVPLSLMMSFINDWNSNKNPGDSSGFFENFNIIAWFFIIFKIAQKMMELFVIKVADSIYRSLSLSTALVVIGIMQHPFDFEVNYEVSSMKLATGLVIAGIWLYTIMDHYFLYWSQSNELEDDQEYRDLPTDFNETLSKGYQTVRTVSSSISNTDVFLNVDESARNS